jgi:hypothetical protein
MKFASACQPKQQAGSLGSPIRDIRVIRGLPRFNGLTIHDLVI